MDGDIQQLWVRKTTELQRYYTSMCKIQTEQYFQLPEWARNEIMELSCAYTNYKTYTFDYFAELQSEVHLCTNKYRQSSISRTIKTYWNNVVEVQINHLLLRFKMLDYQSSRNWTRLTIEEANEFATIFYSKNG